MRFVNNERIEVSEAARAELEAWCEGKPISKDGALAEEGKLIRTGPLRGLVEGTVAALANGNRYLFPPVPASVKTGKALKPYVRNVRRQLEAEHILRKYSSRLDDLDELLEEAGEKPIDPQDATRVAPAQSKPSLKWPQKKLRFRLREMGGRDLGPDAAKEELLGAIERLQGGDPKEERLDFALPKTVEEAERAARALGAEDTGTEEPAVVG